MALPDVSGQMVLPLPPLPRLPIAARQMEGPTPWSNWVIKDRVLAGAFPGSVSVLTPLLRLGVDVFVCLQAEVNMDTPADKWHEGLGLRPYVQDVNTILQQAKRQKDSRIKYNRPVEYLRLSIVDGSIACDSSISRLADDCISRVHAGKKLYIHCWGGHGRTGSLVALMLARLYKLPAPQALRYTQALHDVRKCHQNVRSPTTDIQIHQVKRILGRCGPREGESIGSAGSEAGFRDRGPSTSVSAVFDAQKAVAGLTLLSATAVERTYALKAPLSVRSSNTAVTLAKRTSFPSAQTSPYSARPLWGPPVAVVGPRAYTPSRKSSGVSSTLVEDLQRIPAVRAPLPT